MSNQPITSLEGGAIVHEITSGVRKLHIPAKNISHSADHWQDEQYLRVYVWLEDQRTFLLEMSGNVFTIQKMDPQNENIIEPIINITVYDYDELQRLPKIIEMALRGRLE